MDDIEEFGASLANKDPRKRPTAEEAMKNYAKVMGISLQKYMPIPLIDKPQASSPIINKIKRQEASRNLIVATAPPAVAEPTNFSPPVYTNPFLPQPAKFVPPVYKNPFEKTDKKMEVMRQQFAPNPVRAAGKKTKKRRVRFS
jgi:hypothetical protein